MFPKRLLALALLLALVAGACSAPGSSDADGADRAANADGSGVTADADSDDDVATGDPPAPPSSPSPPSPPVPPPAPPDADAGADAPAYDPALINFGGYRSAPFNSDADAVRDAADTALQGEPGPDDGAAGCWYLMPPTGPDGYRYAFMMENGKFVRMDIAIADIVAPGGLVVGMTAADVRAAFPGVGEKPHHYTDGKYLVVAPPDGGEARLVFETDAAGTILRWRIGLEPQVHYVEGCS